MKQFYIATTTLLAISSGTLFSNPKEVMKADKVSTTEVGKKVVPVDISHFIKGAFDGEVVKEERKLSDGSLAMCYVIKTYSLPQEHKMGPWAPKTINDGNEAGGIWLHEGKVHDVDGAFIKNIATFYNDPEWKLYNDDGTVRITETKEAFLAAARPDVAAEYNNYVVEGKADWVKGKVTTYVIPVIPSYQEKPVLLGGAKGGKDAKSRPPRTHSHDGSEHHHHRGKRPDGPPSGGKGKQGAGEGGVGLAFNGVNFDPPAPVHAILAAHTIAPFDDAGGHLNPHAGYHYHAVTGHTKEIAQEDGHAPMIGYVLDGFGLYAYLDEAGNPPANLDECGGHYDAVRGYHYHAGAPGSNQIIKGFRGATVASSE